jgi:hypothetical protein
MEIMQASTSKGCDVVFCFDIEVGEKMHRESFEWRQIKRSSDDSEAKGIELVRLSTSSNDAQSSSVDSSRQGSSLKSMVATFWIGLRRIRHPSRCIYSCCSYAVVEF